MPTSQPSFLGFSAEQWVLIITALGGLATILGGVAVKVIVELGKLKVMLVTAKAEREATATVVKDLKTQADQQVGRSDEIHAMVNDNLSKVKEELAVANAKVGGLADAITDLKSERSKAQAPPTKPM